MNCDVHKICIGILKLITDQDDIILTREEVISLLKKRGSKKQLIMFLVGPAGSGKSHVIEACRQCCKILCDHAEVTFANDVFKITAVTGAAAAQLVSWTTVHKAAELKNTYV